MEPAAPPVRASNVEEVHEIPRTVFSVHHIFEGPRTYVHNIIIKLVDSVIREFVQERK